MKKTIYVLDYLVRCKTNLGNEIKIEHLLTLSIEDINVKGSCLFFTSSSFFLEMEYVVINDPIVQEFLLQTIKTKSGNNRRDKYLFLNLGGRKVHAKCNHLFQEINNS